MSDDTKRVETRGRKATINQQIVDAILPVIAQGVPWAYTANLAGVTPETMRRWIYRGEEIARAVDDGEMDPPEVEPDSVYYSFYVGVQHAREKAITKNLLYIQQAARGGYITETSTKTNRDGSKEVVEKRTAPDWRAADRFLKYAAPRDFGDKPQQVEISGAGGGPIQVEGMQGLASRLAARAIEDGNTIDGEVVEEDE